MLNFKLFWTFKARWHLYYTTNCLHVHIMYVHFMDIKPDVTYEMEEDTKQLMKKLNYTAE